jgi:hypothetical protein
LWAGVLTGPVVWAALLETNYVLSYVACEQRHTWMLYAATLVALALIGLAGFGAWRAAPPSGALEQPSHEPERTGEMRARFMAIGGLALCAFFALVIIVTAIPAVVLQPCSW